MKLTIALSLLVIVVAAPVYAISEGYRQQLQQSGCTQLSDDKGCDIHKTKAENASDIKYGVEQRVTGKTRAEASEAITALGWHQRTKSPLVFTKDAFTLKLTVNNSNGTVVGVSVE